MKGVIISRPQSVKFKVQFKSNTKNQDDFHLKKKKKSEEGNTVKPIKGVNK